MRLYMNDCRSRLKSEQGNRRERCGSQRGSKPSGRTHSKMQKLKMLVADLRMKLQTD